MSLTPHDIARMLDHSTLQPFLTEDDIRRGCELALKYNTASVCARPCDVPILTEMLRGSDVKVCTVIGFPNGYNTTAVKCFEAETAVNEGAAEIDMVINLGWVKDQKWGALLAEIKAVKAACHGKLLKVIIETCLLTEDEKIKLCRVVSDSGAEYIKTSTGFGGGGATREDVALMKAHVAPHVQIKAAGGIASLQDAEDFVALGASRLGTSRVVKAVKAQEG